jgi:ribosome biogenesis GTPase
MREDTRREDAQREVETRLADYARAGYPVFLISTFTGEGLLELKKNIREKFSVLVGQSGVGKSSIVNALVPELAMKTGAINEKFDRGNHVTTQAVLLDVPIEGANGTQIIDTPGIRRFALAGIAGDEIILHMREFSLLAGKCAFGLSCSHQTEAGCKIREAVDGGIIHQARYESYLRICDELLNGKLYPDND